MRVERGRQNQRLVARDVGKCRRGHVGAGLGELYRKIGDGRILQLGEQAAHAFLHLLDGADMGKGAAAELGGTRHQIGIGCRPDADHEHARTAAG